MHSQHESGDRCASLMVPPSQLLAAAEYGNLDACKEACDELGAKVDEIMEVSRDLSPRHSRLTWRPQGRNPVIVADKVDIRRGSAVRIFALVDSANGATGIVTLLDIDVRVDAATRIEDKLMDDPTFSVDDINPGDYVEVRGTEDVNGAGDVLASRLERDDPEDDTELQGFVTAVNEAGLSFTILGVTIQTDGLTRFFDANEMPIDPGEFFDQADGRLVSAKGVETMQTVIRAVEVELED